VVVEKIINGNAIIRFQCPKGSSIIGNDNLNIYAPN